MSHVTVSCQSCESRTSHVTYNLVSLVSSSTRADASSSMNCRHTARFCCSSLTRLSHTGAWEGGGRGTRSELKRNSWSNRVQPGSSCYTSWLLVWLEAWEGGYKHILHVHVPVQFLHKDKQFYPWLSTLKWLLVPSVAGVRLQSYYMYLFSFYKMISIQ